MTPDQGKQMLFVCPIGSIGGGISESALAESLALRPAFLASDAGTTDAGPFSLGTGLPAFPREAVKRDLKLILKAGREAEIPVIVGSAGTAGGDIHVDWVLEITREVVAEQSLKLRTAVIYSDQDKNYLKGLLREGRILPLDPAPPINDDVIDRSARIVGMMGVEPIQEAIRKGAEFVLAGRCSDPALFAAIPMMHGFPAGMCWHAGKLSECGTLVCESISRSKGVIAATVSQDEITIWPVGPNLRCTPQSVAAHSMYETAEPYLHRESSGTLDLTNCSYRAINDTTVAVRGSRYIPDTYTIKLEGAELVGYQSILIGGIRDPLVIRQLDAWLANITGYVQESVSRLLGLSAEGKQYSLVFHRYGIDAVMGSLEPRVAELPHEVGLLLEVTASTQAQARSIAELCRQPLLHFPIKEWTGSTTLFACAHNPAVVDRGAVYRFNLHHVAVPATPTEMFRTRFLDLEGGTQS